MFFGCGDISKKEQEVRDRYRFALESWVNGKEIDDEIFAQVSYLLVEKTEKKEKYVEHIIKRVLDNGYKISELLEFLCKTD